MLALLFEGQRRFSPAHVQLPSRRRLQEEARAADAVVANLRQTAAAAEAKAAAARHDTSVLQQRLAAVSEKCQHAPTPSQTASPVSRPQHSAQSSPARRVSADGLAVFIEDPLAVMRAIESLRQALAAKDGELADVRQQLDASIEEQRALQSLVAELREQAAALQGAAEAQCVGDVDALDARLAESRQRSAEGTEAGQLHGVVLAKEREIEMLRAQLEQTGASEGSAAEEVSKLRRALAVKDRHIEALRREVEELGSALAADGAGGDAAADAGDLQQAAAEAESSWRALAKKDSEMDGLRADTLQLEGLLAAKDRELAGLRERLEANARGDARDAEAVAAAEAQVRQIEAALSEAESERRTLQRKVAELQGELVLVTVERDCLAAAKAPPALTVEVCLAFLTSFL